MDLWKAAAARRKGKRFAMKLINGLRSEAWRAVEPLVLDLEKLKTVDGYKLVPAALQKIEKEGVVRKTEALDYFFENTVRKHGEPINQRSLGRAIWTKNSAMSED